MGKFIDELMFSRDINSSTHNCLRKQSFSLSILNCLRKHSVSPSAHSCLRKHFSNPLTLNCLRKHFSSPSILNCYGITSLHTHVEHSLDQACYLNGSSAARAHGLPISPIIAELPAASSPSLNRWHKSFSWIGQTGK